MNAVMRYDRRVAKATKRNQPAKKKSAKRAAKMTATPAPSAVVQSEPFEGYNNLVAREAWTSRAIASTRFSSREAAITQWLIDSEYSDHSELRARFSHRLNGVNGATIERLAFVVRSICEALEAGDAQAMQHFARAESNAIVRALAIVERFISNFKANALDDLGEDSCALELTEGWPALAACDELSSQLVQEANSLQRGKRDAKTARGVLAGLMVSARISPNRAAARTSIKDAEKSYARRKI